jgi:hypothetical protein
MVFVGLIPYSNFRGETHYLLGREAYEDGFRDSGKWSGFGGGLEKKDHSICRGIAREAYEESMGFLGNAETLEEAIDNRPLYLLNKSGYTAYSHLPAPSIFSPTQTPTLRSSLFDAYVAPLPIAYNSDLPDLYIRVYDYVADATPRSKRMRRTKKSPLPDCPAKIPARDGWYEKVEIDWFTLQEIMEERDKMRPAFVKSLLSINQLGQGPLFQETLF